MRKLVIISLIFYKTSLMSLGEETFFRVSKSNRIYNLIPCRIEFDAINAGDLRKYNYKSNQGKLCLSEDKKALIYLNKNCNSQFDTIFIERKDKRKACQIYPIYLKINLISSKVITYNISLSRYNEDTVYLKDKEYLPRDKSSYPLITAEILNFDYILPVKIKSFKVIVTNTEGKNDVLIYDSTNQNDIDRLLKRLVSMDKISLSNVIAEINSREFHLQEKSWTVK